ncbi:MAG: hypothetical protein ACSLFF_02045 [Solirubrobacterales bacterium]
MRLLRKHLTYANVMSSLAIFLLLGGTAFAAGRLSGSRLKNYSVSGKKLKSGSVSNSKLRSNAVTNSKIRAASIYGSRLASNTLTDREINMTKLGKIAKAATADTATNAGKVDSKDASQLVVKCPGGTVDLGSFCAETGARAAVSGYSATQSCTAAGGYLPRAAELVGADRANKISVSSDEWSSDWSGTSATLVSGDSIGVTADVSSASQPYRCFYMLRER